MLCLGSAVTMMAEWILGFCQDGPTPHSLSQTGAKVESSRGLYESAFSQKDLHEWSPLVINQQQLFSVIDFTKSARSQIVDLACRSTRLMVN